MKIERYSFPSATGVCNIVGNKYTPDNSDVKAVIVIHHGMAEHKKRYHSFFEFLTSNGYAVYMHDMANHGESNDDINLIGYFGKKDGYKGIVNDMKTACNMAKSDYPELPLFVMGHSMGSFVTRCLTAWYPELNLAGAIYMGTGGYNKIAGMGDVMSSLVAKATGYTKKVALLDKMTFGAYGDKFEHRTNFDWLTRDTKIVDEYIKDDFCGFLFSAQGMNDLVKLNIIANSEEFYKGVPADLPIFVISGALDPVGEYSKGIVEIGEKLKASGHTKSTVKLYDECRHELLNELNKEEVYNDLLNWLNALV